MTLVKIDIRNVASETHPDDRVLIRSTTLREASDGGLISTAETSIPLVEGIGEKELAPGPVVVNFQCRGITDTRPKRGTVPDDGEVGIEQVIGGAFEYTPPVVNRGLDLIEGARDEALGQVDHAVESAIIGTGGETVRRMVGITEVTPTPGTVWAHTTEDGARLPLGYGEDGHLDEHAKNLFAEDVTNTFFTPDDGEFVHVQVTTDGRIISGIRADGTIFSPGGPPSPPAGEDFATIRTIEHDPQYAHIVMDEQGYILSAIRWNGSVYQPGAPTGGGGMDLRHEKYIDDGGEVAPVIPDMTVMLGWGSSTMHALAAHMTPIMAGHGVTYMQEAHGGERAEGTAARLGSRPARVIFPDNTIPGGTAPVVIEIPNLAGNNFIRPYLVTVGGVQGEITVSGGVFRFARTASGDPVPIDPETPAIPVVGPAHRDKVHLISTGKNNINDPNELDIIPEINQIVDEMHMYMTPLFKRVLMVGHFANANYSQSSTAYQRVMAMNTHLKTRYGQHYIDVHEIVTTDLLWQLTGITPTTEDLQHQARGVIPPSVQFNLGHLNTAGEAAVAQVIHQRLQSLGWY